MFLVSFSIAFRASVSWFPCGGVERGNRRASRRRSGQRASRWPVPGVKGWSRMQLVEQHVIDRKDPRYAVIDAAAFKSKNLYNAALYEMRQAFFHDGTYLTYNDIQRRMQSHEAYKALPPKVTQQIF